MKMKLFLLALLLDISTGARNGGTHEDDVSTVATFPSSPPSNLKGQDLEYDLLSEISEFALSNNNVATAYENIISSLRGSIMEVETRSPSSLSSSLHTAPPSSLPTTYPSMYPSLGPSTKTSATPSIYPSSKPSTFPSISPSFAPSTLPSLSPSLHPTQLPSPQPTLDPTATPKIQRRYSNEVTFSVLGDTPYTDREARALPSIMRDIPSKSHFVVHVGDIRDGDDRCKESSFEDVADMLKNSPVPVFIIPGDNDWYDCPSKSEAWRYWMSTFRKFENKWRYSSKRYWPSGLNVYHQEDYEENFGFFYEGILFIGVHLIGGKTLDDTYEANVEWTKDMLDKFGDEASTVVIFGHAEPGSKHRHYFRDVDRDLKKQDKPVVYICGDGHRYKTFRVSNTSGLRGIMVDNGDAKPLQVTIKDGEVYVNRRDGSNIKRISTW